MLLISSMGFFLSNPQNKQMFVTLLGNIAYCLHEAVEFFMQEKMLIHNCQNCSGLGIYYQNNSCSFSCVATYAYSSTKTPCSLEADNSRT